LHQQSSLATNPKQQQRCSFAPSRARPSSPA
jgi:hypothetical protein